MNSVDAGATRCDIVIDRETFSIYDDGKGFANETEIEEFFETFGTPHEEGDATYGRFRMGRGQIFSFGVNKWATNEFRMTVDLKPQKDEKGKEFALGYDYEVAEEKVEGCRIEVALYDKLKPSQLDGTIRNLQDYVKFVSIPVTLNGKVISSDVTKQKWDHETDTLRIKKRESGSLDVYNQGVLVAKYPSYKYGTGGLVVSKVPLDVNFARNDVQATCKVFKKAIEFLSEDTLKAAKRSAPLNDDQRENIARRLAAGDVDLNEIKDARIVTDVTGSHHKVSTLFGLDGYKYNVSIASRGDRIAEMAHTRKIAFVITPETAARFGADTPEEFAEILKRIAAENNYYKPRINPMPYSKFLEVISSNHEPLKDTELNKAERLALKSIRAAYKVMMTEGYHYDRRTKRAEFSTSDKYNHRRIFAGQSDTALAWTDGRENIWIKRDELKSFRDGMRGMIRLTGLLLHEQLHEEPSTGTHEHGVEFYNRYHNLTVYSDIIGRTAGVMLKTCVTELRDQNQNVMITFGRDEDLVAEGAGLGLGQEETVPEADGAEAEEPRLAALS
jgi:hypothetical protein